MELKKDVFIGQHTYHIGRVSEFLPNNYFLAWLLLRHY